MLPSYVIAGTVRSGTTSLHRMLKQHPDVAAADVKEVHFFDRNFERGTAWYEQQFPQGHTHQIAGEATPNYVYDPRAIERMAQVIPDAKIVVLVRNPVERAYSQYWMQRESGHETLTFAAAIAAEADRLSDGDDRSRAFFSYVDRGMYLEQLERLRAHYPAKQTLILLYEDMRDRPGDVYQAVCEFVGISPDLQPDGLGERANQYRTFRSARVRALTRKLSAHGRGGRTVARAISSINSRATRYPPMDAGVRATLEERFSDPNAQLAHWLGRGLHEWAPTSRQAGA